MVEIVQIPHYSKYLISNIKMALTVLINMWHQISYGASKSHLLIEVYYILHLLSLNLFASICEEIVAFLDMK